VKDSVDLTDLVHPERLGLNLEVIALAHHDVQKVKDGVGLTDPEHPERPGLNLEVIALAHHDVQKVKDSVDLTDLVHPERPRLNLGATGPVRHLPAGLVRQRVIAHRILVVRANLLVIKKN